MIDSHTNNRGVSLLEAVIATAIISVSVFGIVSVFQYLSSHAIENTRDLQAQYLAQEGIEALRLMRDDSWSSRIAPLSDTTTYSLEYASSSDIWKSTTTPQTTEDGFTRTFTVDEVQRDSNDDIVESGGSNDPDTRKFNVVVEWGSATSTRREVNIYLTNIHDN